MPGIRFTVSIHYDLSEALNSVGMASGMERKKVSR